MLQASDFNVQCSGSEMLQALGYRLQALEGTVYESGFRVSAASGLRVLREPYLTRWTAVMTLNSKP
jgi:hypothetical protein